MPIQISCACGKKLQVRDELAGKKIKCPGCGAIQLATAAEAPPEEPAPKPKAPPPPVKKPQQQKPEPEDEEEEAPAPKPKAPQAKVPPKSKPEPQEEEEQSPPEESEEEESETPEGMMANNKFIVRQQTKMFSATMAYDIVDGDSGEVLGIAKPNISFMAQLLSLVFGKDKMSLTIEFREKPNNKLVFAVRRSGIFFKKVQLLDARGQVLGQYKAKKFSLSGGFHVYDKKGTHFAEIKGKMFKSDYTFLTPDGEKMGSVAKTWGGLAKSLFTGAGTFGVQIEPEFADNKKAKMLILGAAIAIHVLFKTKSSGGGGGGGGDEEDGGGDLGGED